MSTECEICGGDPCDFPEECNPRREKLESEEYKEYIWGAHCGAVSYDSLLERSYDSRLKIEQLEADKAELVDELRSYEDCYLGPNTKRLIAKHRGSQ